MPSNHYKTQIGSEANAWNNELTGVNGTSNSIDIELNPFVSIFGTTDAATTLTVQLSQDNTNFYDSEDTISANGNFGTNITVGAKFIRLLSDTDVTATVTITAKG